MVAATVQHVAIERIDNLRIGERVSVAVGPFGRIREVISDLEDGKPPTATLSPVGESLLVGAPAKDSIVETVNLGLGWSQD